MSNPTCFQSLQASRFRVTQLDANGAPVTGAGHGYVSDAIVDLTLTLVFTTGADVVQLNGSGAQCATFKDIDRLKRVDLALNLCQLDAQLIAFMTEQPTFNMGGQPIGWQFPASTQQSLNGVALEVWTRAWDGGAQAVPAFTSPNIAWWHWVFPKTQWTVGNLKMDSGFMVVPMSGSSFENTRLTANGPYNDYPTGVAGPGGVTHSGGVFLDSNVPAAACATITVPAGS